MYIFIAHYINMDTDVERTKMIDVDSQHFDTSTEVYVYAMHRACEMRGVNEILSDLEFIAC